MQAILRARDREWRCLRMPGRVKLGWAQVCQLERSLGGNGAVERTGRDPVIVRMRPLQLPDPAPGRLAHTFIELQSLALGDAGDPPPIGRPPQQGAGADGGGSGKVWAKAGAVKQAAATARITTLSFGSI